VKEEQFKVLKTMSEATSRMDVNMFAQKLNLTPNQTIHQIQELAEEGFLKRVGNGYGITEKGKAALKAFAPVPQEMGFHFYYLMDQPSDFSAQTLEEFYRIIQKISVDSLEFHLFRGDFEKWLKGACKNAELADAIGDVKATELKGENLRKELLEVLNLKYNIQELL
jgi:predicted transcriptional regulator